MKTKFPVVLGLIFFVHFLLAQEIRKTAPTGTGKSDANSSGEKMMVNFDRMPLGQVLDLYSDLTGRIVLRPSNLPITTFLTIKSGLLTKPQAVVALEGLMTSHHFRLIPAGEKFLFLFNEGDAASLGKPIRESTELLAKAEKNNNELRDMVLNFDNVPLGKVLERYSDLTGRAVIYPCTLPVTTFLSVRTQKPITKNEAAAALEALMAINHFATVRVDEKYVFVFVQGNAPAMESPMADFSKKLAAAKKITTDQSQKIPLLKFDNVPLPQVCDSYAQLRGRDVQMDEKVRNLRYIFIRFNSRSAVSKEEAGAVLETLFAVNGLEVTPDGDKLKLVMKGN